jgi:F-type H+-transporting ATPase subunit b
MATDHNGHEASVAAPGGHPAEGSAFPPFDQANFSSLLIWLVLTFGALYLLMSKIALPRIHDILHDRMATINADLKEANRMRHAADEAGVAQDKALSDAKARAQSLAQETHAALAAEADSKRHALEADLNAKLVAAEAQIADMKSRALANVGSIAEEATSAIVQRLTGKPADAAAVTAAVAAATK